MYSGIDYTSLGNMVSGGEVEKSKENRRRARSPTANLSDGKQIDLVLSYRPMDPGRAKRAHYAKYRRRFENELRGHGFELEYESRSMSKDGETAYVKLHAPFDVLARQAELCRLRKPTRHSDLRTAKAGPAGALTSAARRWFGLQPGLEYPREDYFTEPFTRKARAAFLLDDATLFSPAERARLAWDAANDVRVDVARARGQQGQASVTVEYLLEIGVYQAAFPLHDCDLFHIQQYEKYKKRPPTTWPLRVYLYETWVRPSQLLRAQPLDAIRDYLGERVALYFAWLGFYTTMLTAPALVGTLVLVHGGARVGAGEVAQQACSNQTLADLVVCRSCPFQHCDFKYVRAFCHMAQFEGIFDNELTVPFSLFTAVWAVLLLVFWKRYRAHLLTRWNVDEDGRAGEDDEPTRPQYEMTAPERRRNPVTGRTEAYVPRGARLRRTVWSAVGVSVCLLLVVGFVAMVNLYRVFGPFWWSKVLGDDERNADYGMIVSVTGAFASGLFIGVMSRVFRRLALHLTRAENPRTESRFERSYARKVVLFEWVNYFGALSYLSFVRGQIPPAPPPGRQSFWEVQCPVTGCLLDVVIWLAVIYIGKQAFDTFLTIAGPLLRLVWAKLTSLRRGRGRSGGKNVRWEEDRELAAPHGSLFLFAEHLRLFIQYCFVTMFVPAFPIAPLFALLNNVLEMRLTAYRMLVLTRRPVPGPVRGPDLWDGLVETTTRAAILTNALLIAFTTDFVPRTAYRFGGNSPDYSLTGYVQHFLSEFNTSDWKGHEHLAYWHSSNHTVDVCYYRDYRVSPWAQNPAHGQQAYDTTPHWWHVLVARLSFILLFEHAIFLLQSVIQYLVPAVPSDTVRLRKREMHVLRERFMNREKRKTNNKAYY